MTDLRIDDDIFNVMVEGDVTKPALMLSHALGADLTMWDAQIPALTDHFRVVRYDTRGHGGSAVSDTSISIERLGRDALAILDALEIDRVHWIGLSMGGAIGQWLLLNAPDRIDRAVLANTAAKLGSPDTWNQRILTTLSGDRDAAADATMERWFSPDFKRATPGHVAAIDTVLRKTDPHGYAACCGALRDMDLRQALLSKPSLGDSAVLVVTGIDDPVISAADTAFLTQAFAGAKHVALDARHLSNVEADAAFTAAVVGFLTAKPTRHKASRPRVRVAKVAPAIRRPAKSRSIAARGPLKSTAKPTAPRRETAGRPAGRAATGAPAAKNGRGKTSTAATTKAIAAQSPRTNCKTPARPPSRPAVVSVKSGRAKVAGRLKRAVVTPKSAKGTATKTATKTKTSPAPTVSARRTPTTAAARRPVKKPTASRGASPKTTSAPLKAARTKPVAAKASIRKSAANKSVTGRAIAGKTAAGTPRSPKASTKPVATRTKAPASKAPASKKSTSTSKKASASKASTRVAASKAPAKAPASKPAASKAPPGRRKPASPKLGRPVGRRKP